MAKSPDHIPLFTNAYQPPTQAEVVIVPQGKSAGLAMLEQVNKLRAQRQANCPHTESEILSKRYYCIACDLELCFCWTCTLVGITTGKTIQNVHPYPECSAGDEHTGRAWMGQKRSKAGQL